MGDLTGCLWDICCDLCGAGAHRAPRPFLRFGWPRIASRWNAWESASRSLQNSASPSQKPSSCRKAELTQSLRLGKASKITDSNLWPIPCSLDSSPSLEGVCPTSSFYPQPSWKYPGEGWFFFPFLEHLELYISKQHF